MPANVSDLRKLASDLRAASGTAEKLSRAVVAKTAADIERDAKNRAPVDTGALRNSISHSITGGGMSADIGPTVSYAPYLEYGTSRMAPQPYMMPAADKHLPLFEKAVEQIAERLL